MENNLVRLLARLTALKQNLPKNGYTPEKYVEEFNLILNGLEELTKESLGDFKISESEIKPKVLSWNMLSGKKQYSDEKYCDKDFLLMKIDGVLGYFTLLLQPAEIKGKLGFNIEEK